ncbi:hypothetical protein AVEN_180986-1 [Araneus ventricosus]|uniref:Uncharacterized protein n=1 Tax=Araneus ventricosus TaxID=182803 RepID=A0A4Y2RDT8_ARAVE|nr:hypothetical protein AVEN_180986-1 [Araneus ventricosus]
MIAFIQINRVLASSPREPRRNLSAATKHGDLTDKTPSAYKNNILSLSSSPSNKKDLSFNLEREVSERGLQIRTRSPRPNLNGESGSLKEIHSKSERGIRMDSPSP